MNRDDKGREVREVWVAWARRQPDPKPSWLVPWEDLPEEQREVDRQIGERLFTLGLIEGVRQALGSAGSALSAEAAQFGGPGGEG